MNSKSSDEAPSLPKPANGTPLIKDTGVQPLKNLPHTVTESTQAATIMSVPVEVTPAPRTGSLLSEIRSITQRGGKTNKGG